MAMMPSVVTHSLDKPVKLLSPFPIRKMERSVVHFNAMRMLYDLCMTVQKVIWLSLSYIVHKLRNWNSKKGMLCSG